MILNYLLTSYQLIELGSMSSQVPVQKLCHVRLPMTDTESASQIIELLLSIQVLSE